MLARTAGLSLAEARRKVLGLDPAKEVALCLIRIRFEVVNDAVEVAIRSARDGHDRLGARV